MNKFWLVLTGLVLLVASALSSTTFESIELVADDVKVSAYFKVKGSPFTEVVEVPINDNVERRVLLYCAERIGGCEDDIKTELFKELYTKSKSLKRLADSEYKKKRISELQDNWNDVISRSSEGMAQKKVEAVSTKDLEEFVVASCPFVVSDFLKDWNIAAAMKTETLSSVLVNEDFEFEVGPNGKFGTVDEYVKWNFNPRAYQSEINDVVSQDYLFVPPNKTMTKYRAFGWWLSGKSMSVTRDAPEHPAFRINEVSVSTSPILLKHLQGKFIKPEFLRDYDDSRFSNPYVSIGGVKSQTALRREKYDQIIFITEGEHDFALFPPNEGSAERTFFGAEWARTASLNYDLQKGYFDRSPSLVHGEFNLTKFSPIGDPFNKNSGGKKFGEFKNSKRIDVTLAGDEGIYIPANWIYAVRSHPYGGRFVLFQWRFEALYEDIGSKTELGVNNNKMRSEASRRKKEL